MTTTDEIETTTVVTAGMIGGMTVVIVTVITTAVTATVTMTVDARARALLVCVPVCGVVLMHQAVTAHAHARLAAKCLWCCADVAMD